jgi:hypothetical protein
MSPRFKDNSGTTMHDFFDFLGFIVFWTFVAAIILVPLYLRHRERQQMHETLRIAYEKGQPVPPELIEALQSKTPVRSMSTPDRDLRIAVILIAVGLGFAGLGYGVWYGLMTVDDTAAYISGGSTAGVGAIPGLIGLGYLVLWLARRKTPTV